MSKNRLNNEEIRELLFENAEKGFIHMTHSEDMLRFHYLMNGDIRAIDDTDKVFEASLQGKLSKDPLRNYKYLFIVNTGLAARFAIEAGVPLETSYSVSDLYIQRADEADSIDEVKELNKEVFKTYVDLVNTYKRENLYSKPVLACLNYIDSHFNEKITLGKLGEITGLNPVYLASLFKKQTGVTIVSYITSKRVETAKALLTRTDYSCLQIAYSLSFCSQSRFIEVFREQTGYTPKSYRDTFHNQNISLISPLTLPGKNR